MSYHNLESWQRRVYRSRSWEATRRAVWDRQHGLCADCAEHGVLTALLLHKADAEDGARADVMEFHHVTPLTPENSSNPSIAFGLGNVVGLCHACHEARHKGLGTYTKAVEPPRWMWFDENGMPHEGGKVDI